MHNVFDNIVRITCYGVLFEAVMEHHAFVLCPNIDVGLKKRLHNDPELFVVLTGQKEDLLAVLNLVTAFLLGLITASS